MRAEIDEKNLVSLIEQTVAATVQHMASHGFLGSDQIAVTEANAAALLDVPRHVLRDARLRGEISAKRIGRRCVYALDDLRLLVTQ